MLLTRVSRDSRRDTAPSTDADIDIYDAFGSSSGKTEQHLDTICALASGISAAQAKFPVVSSASQPPLA